ncbi:hypothetical protein MBLNU230_g0684t1 [Neophaeotheca triangularis]
MAPRIKDWLGSFVESELNSGLEHRQLRQKIKQEPGIVPDAHTGHIQSDFINLKSVTKPPNGSTVRISSIEENDGQNVTITITDGFSKTTALLAVEAKNQLKEETGVDLVPEMWSAGDLISILECEVVMLPAFEIVILSLEYDGTWRKDIGQPTPLIDRQGIKKVLAEIEKVRDIDPPLSSSRTKSRAAHPPHTSSRAPPPAPQGQPEPQSQVVPATQPAVVTPLRRRPQAPTLAGDGFEIAQGVNMAGPVSLGSARPAHSSSRLSPPADPAGLLKVLGNKKQAAEEKAALATAVPVAAQVAVSRSPAPANISAPISTPAAPSVNPEAVRKHRLEKQKSAAIKYGARPVPAEQQAVLDCPDAWFPGGKISNGPIEGIKKWNKGGPMASDSTSSQPSQASGHLPTLSRQAPAPSQTGRPRPSTGQSGSLTPSSQASNDTSISWESSPARPAANAAPAAPLASSGNQPPGATISSTGSSVAQSIESSAPAATPNRLPRGSEDPSPTRQERSTNGHHAPPANTVTSQSRDRSRDPSERHREYRRGFLPTGGNSYRRPPSDYHNE